MSSLNKVILIGYLGSRPETKSFDDGNSVTNFRMATSERWRDSAGEQKEATEWHRIVVRGRQGEACSECLDKGALVCVEGSIRTREYVDKEGANRSVVEIAAHSVTFLDRKEKSGGGSSGGGYGKRKEEAPPAAPPPPPKSGWGAPKGKPAGGGYGPPPDDGNDIPM